METMVLRQGDVGILVGAGKKTRQHKPVRRERGRIVLAHGTATGHSHAIASKGATMYELPPAKSTETTTGARARARTGAPAGADRVLVCTSAVKLEHDEHATITVPKGTHLVRIQREYVPGEAPRTVED